MYYMVNSDRYNRLTQAAEKVVGHELMHVDSESEHESMDVDHEDKHSESRLKSAEAVKTHKVQPKITVESPMPVESVLQAIPQRFRNKASKFLHLLETGIQWDHKGQLIKADGNVIINSSISEALRDAIWPYKHKQVLGRQYIKDAIQRMHLHQSLFMKDVQPTAKPAPLKKKAANELQAFDGGQLPKGKIPWFAF